MTETDPSKPTAETLVELWKGTADRLRERRSYEWKLTLGLWAALLAAPLTATKLKPATMANETKPCLTLVLVLLSVAVVALHSIFLFGYVRRFNQSDNAIAAAYERLLSNNTEVENARKSGGSVLSQVFQAGMTVVLVTLSASLVARGLYWGVPPA